jgi:hypothetical protein
MCRERGLKAQIKAEAPHELRRTWIGDLLDLGVDLASVSTTGKYNRRDSAVQRRSSAALHVPYVSPED